MKSPQELAVKLARQWQLSDVREERILNPDAWPISMPIGQPSSSDLTHRTEQVRVHLSRWRAVRVGHIEHKEIRFRAGAEPVSVPVSWQLRNSTEWIQAAADPVVAREHQVLQTLLPQIDPLFHRLFVRQRSWLQENTVAEMEHAARVAMALSPHCAGGRPLRSLPIVGTDTKFFERHRSLMLALLDTRFEGRASREGLEQFLGALDDSDHWVLVAPLAPGILPFEQQRVRLSELSSVALPGTHLVIVENETSLHQLPPLPQTVAILGAGLDLEWVSASWLGSKKLAYWGDIDTWGLTMLARVRLHQPHVTALLMNAEAFEAYAANCAVIEPQPASVTAPQTLTEEEAALYFMLHHCERGRLEQEFLPSALVAEAFTRWHRL